MSKRTLRTISLSQKEFQTIPPNPIQRDTIRHARLSIKPYGHLANASPTHAKVSIAEFPSGKRVVLDGHSRRYLWRENLLDAPDKLSVDVYPINKMDEARVLYLQFDSSQATESGQDKLFGSLKFLGDGWEPDHKFFRSAGLISSCKYLVFPKRWEHVKRLSMTDLLKPHMPALKVMDRSMDVIRNPARFPSYMTCAFLLATTAHGSAALPFFEAYYLGEGIKVKDKADGVFMAEERYQQIKAERGYRGFGGGAGTISRETPYILWCYDQWKAGKRIKIGRGKGNPKSGIVSNSIDLPSVREWWDINIGDLYYPELHRQEEMEV